MNKEKPNQNQCRPLETDDMWQLPMGLHLPPDTVLDENPQGQRIITFPNEIVYPQKGTTPPALTPMLLEEIPSKDTISRHFKLPPNSTTLVTILNEASGVTGPDRELPHEGRTTELMGTLFNAFGQALKTLRNEGVIPGGLEYWQVLVQKDDISFRLLPPLELRRVGDRGEAMLAWRALRTTFVNSIAAGATTPSQRSLVLGIGPMIEKSFNE